MPNPFGIPNSFVKEEVRNPVPKGIKAYYGCNAKNAQRFASRDGDPVALAIAARGMCQSEEADLGRALLRSRSPVRAEDLLGVARKVVLERNAAIIVNERANAVSWRDCNQSKDLELAIRACTELLNRNPKDITAYQMRARWLHHNGDYDRAIADLTKAIELSPNDEVAFTNRGPCIRINPITCSIEDDLLETNSPASLRVTLTR